MDLAEQAEAILDEWEKNGRATNGEYFSRGKSCLIGAYSRVNQCSLSSTGPFHRGSFGHGLMQFLDVQNLIMWNDENDDETVFTALRDFAKYQRGLSDEYRRNPGGSCE